MSIHGVDWLQDNIFQNSFEKMYIENVPFFEVYQNILKLQVLFKNTLIFKFFFNLPRKIEYLLFGAKKGTFFFNRIQ